MVHSRRPSGKKSTPVTPCLSKSLYGSSVSNPVLIVGPTHQVSDPTSIDLGGRTPRVVGGGKGSSGPGRTEGPFDTHTRHPSGPTSTTRSDEAPVEPRERYRRGRRRADECPFPGAPGKDGSVLRMRHRAVKLDWGG